MSVLIAAIPTDKAKILASTELRTRMAVSLCAAACAFAACIPDRPASSHVDLNAAAEPLRATFNADTGRVRVVMLVSPT